MVFWANNVPVASRSVVGFAGNGRFLLCWFSDISLSILDINFVDSAHVFTSFCRTRYRRHGPKTRLMSSVPRDCLLTAPEIRLSIHLSLSNPTMCEIMLKLFTNELKAVGAKV